MVKALFKKQMQEAFAGFVNDRKTKKRRSKKGVIGYSVLYAVLFIYLMAMFYFIADVMSPLIIVGFGEVYMSVMGVVGLAFAVLGSVFNTYSSLYMAKDNDFLLSLPIPTNKILLARLSGVYAMGLMYGLIIMLPATVVYFINAPFNLLSVVFCVLIPFVLSFLSLSLSCILGWIIAVISTKLKNKNIITVIISLIFIAAYYYLMGDSNEFFEQILNNPQGVGKKIKGALYPIYQMGRAAEGEVASMLIFAAIVAVMFAAVYLVLRHSFLKLATTNRGAKKKKYVSKQLKSSSASTALLKKEFRRFYSSANYMLNCGFGIVFMIAASVFLLIKKDDIVFIGSLIGYKDLILLIVCVMACMLTTMNDMTAPSVSLEGKNLWIAQTLPVSGWTALRAKLYMHLILTVIPASVMLICIELVFKPNLFFAVMIPITVLLYILLMAAFGLAVNLKLPNLNWTNEVVPIKQSGSVFFALFGGWGITLAFGALYYLLYDFVAPKVYLLFVCTVMAIANALLLNWLKHKGSKIFEKL